ncbi:MAG: Re/Si-specific NAD(P)(+) transhydrogenase subunit alpha [Candidatus Sumerlaeaceae bacterium]|nr:Re/Si-specific NAD(P)(+) transhydrogenase subunit alpha [Candidatus Sumerlaeaceae bacterium]
MKLGVPKETFPGERRVAVVPAVVPALVKNGIEVVVEPGAGTAAGFPDDMYTAKGAVLATSRAELFSSADIVVYVRGPGSNTTSGEDDFPLYRKDQVVTGFLDPLTSPVVAQNMAARGVTAFSMEMIPRITRAQSMDALSSMATIAGYKAVLLAADRLPRMFPMLMTAAGTLTAAKVLVVGVGVAGLQAIATSRRLGAVVQAYDVRAAVKEQVQSLGAKFVELPLDTQQAEGQGGYAAAQSEDFLKRQRELMGKVIAESDAVITTAAIPGQKAPILVTTEMVRGMAPGSVVVDIAAERGGNCELTRPGETVIDGGVTILGPLNIPSEIPYHASQMYSKNISALLQLLVKKGELNLDMSDEIIRETMITKGGEVTNPRVRKLLGLPEPVAAGN